MKFILRLKAWILFIALLGPSVLITIYSDYRSVWESVSSMILTAVWYLWMFCINRFFRPKTNLKSKAIVYASLTFIFLIMLLVYGRIIVNNGVGAEYPLAIGVVVTFSFCYNLLSTAKALKSFELRREATLYESYPDAILLLVFPVGVWLLQPRINRLVNDYCRFDTNTSLV